MNGISVDSAFFLQQNKVHLFTKKWLFCFFQITNNTFYLFLKMAWWVFFFIHNFHNVLSLVTMTSLIFWSKAVQTARPVLSGDQSKPETGWSPSCESWSLTTSPTTPTFSPSSSLFALRLAGYLYCQRLRLPLPPRATKTSRFCGKNLPPQIVDFSCFWLKPANPFLGCFVRRSLKIRVFKLLLLGLKTKKTHF